MFTVVPLLMSRISNGVIGCAMEVHRNLGCGFLEAIYENSLVIEFRRNGIHLQRQVPFEICYKGHSVGHYVADLVVEGKLLLELKATSRLAPIDEAQLLNYLAASKIRAGLLINFGSKSLQVKRMVSNYNPADDI